MYGPAAPEKEKEREILESQENRLSGRLSFEQLRFGVDGVLAIRNHSFEDSENEDGWFEPMLKAMSSGKDLSVTREGFMSCLKQPREELPACCLSLLEELCFVFDKAQKRYSVYDPKGSGSISMKVFCDIILSSTTNKLSKVQLREKFAEMDADKTGSISREEFFCYAVTEAINNVRYLRRRARWARYIYDEFISEEAPQQVSFRTVECFCLLKMLHVFRSRLT